MSDIEDIREQYYTVKDDPDPQCLKCGSYKVTARAAVESIAGYELVCEDCGATWL